ncbi:AMP-dependent synthetase/ligase [Dillenia turbinata]|uniref:Long-chain-fatty-acid--CoA ligase n=1 Tax=Dillenia turbinata TaxID=194707 RepID=A0AAN8VWV0_9MAGN
MASFAVKVEEGRRGQDGKPSVGPVYRNLLAKKEFPPPDVDINTAWDIFSISARKFPENRMLGRREFLNGKPGPYLWKKYKEVYEEVLHIGSALRASGAEPDSRVGIYGANCPHWIVAMEACSAHSLICVTLYDTLGFFLLSTSLCSAFILTLMMVTSVGLISKCAYAIYLTTHIMVAGPGAVNYIIEHAEVDFVFVQDKKVKQLLNPDCTSVQRLRLIVSFSSFSKEEKDRAECAGTKPYSWNEFLHLGKENPTEVTPPQPFNICTIMYTSGTSGDPKGVLLTHENVAMYVRGVDLFMEQFEDKMTTDDVYLSFLPLAHILDRMIEEYFFHKGASVGYYHGDINALKEDLAELKPTFFAGVPRVFERVSKKRSKNSILELGWMNLGYKQKSASPLADLLAFRKVKARLGGRVRLMVSGGAPLSSEIEEFLRVTCCAFVTQGYGLTETCGMTTLGYPDEMSMIGTVGPPSVYTELRLEEVPEMGYDPFGNPPCGEICVRGKTVFAGYHKNPELTRECMIDGWYHTGDIGQMLPNGVVKIIDRKKNLIKLSQGEYVAVEYLEKVYAITPIVEDIWVYGDSFKSILVAIVILHEANTKKWASENGHRGPSSELCSLNQLQTFVLSELKAVAERNKLRGFEYIKGVIVNTQPFDAERDLVTPTMKKKRSKLLKYYEVEIDELYKKLMEMKSLK